MASPPKHRHHPSMALQLWGPLIVGFWRSQCLLEETRSCSPKTVCHQALHYFSPCTTEPCLSWQYHRLIPRLKSFLKEGSGPGGDCYKRLWIKPRIHSACICCWKTFVAIFLRTPLGLNDRHKLAAAPTSCRVVEGRAGIWRWCWPLVSYPVDAAGLLLDPLTEVDVKCAGEIAGCWGSWIRCRKESRVSKVRVGPPFPSVLQGTPTPLACSWPGEDGHPSASRQHPGVVESNPRTDRLRSKAAPKTLSPSRAFPGVHW